MTILKYKETRDWVLVQLGNIQTWEPVSYLSIQDNSSRSSNYARPQSTHLSNINAQMNSSKRRGLIIADFDGIDKSEMTVRKGEIVQISKEDGEWLLGSVGARVSEIENCNWNIVTCRKDGFLFHMLNSCKENKPFLVILG